MQYKLAYQTNSMSHVGQPRTIDDIHMKCIVEVIELDVSGIACM